MLKKMIKVTFEFEGFHLWPDAKNHSENYLQFRHRHMFKCEARKEVSHNDRDIEFIQLKRMMVNYIKMSFGVEFKSMSCEAIAEHLLVHFNLDYVEVTEDGENGAIVCRE